MNTHHPRVLKGWGLSALPAIVGALLATASIGAAICGAGTIRHDRSDQAYRDYGNQPQFAAVGRYSAGSLSGSFTLIAPQWALTAAHVVDTNWNGSISDENISDDRLRWGALERRVTDIIIPTGVNGNPGWNGDVNRGFDIALVRLDAPITTIAPAAMYTSFQELGKRMTAVGFGQGGTGQTGATTAGGIKRAGDNVVDEFVTFANGATGLRWDFDEPAPRVSPNFSGSSIPLDMEYQIGPGDSGGGAFIFENGSWLLAGINSATYPIYTYGTTGSDSHTYGDAALFTRLAAYQQFVFSNIPELAVAIPEPAGLAATVLAGLIATRRRRRCLVPTGAGTALR